LHLASWGREGGKYYYEYSTYRVILVRCQQDFYKTFYIISLIINILYGFFATFFYLSVKVDSTNMVVDSSKINRA